MKEIRRLWLHALLLLLAATAAFVLSRPKEEQDKPRSPTEIELWPGRPEQVQELAFETDRQLVTLQARKDEKGAWYFGTVKPAGKPAGPADAGAPDAGRPAPLPPVEETSFASVSVAAEIVKKVAPLRASRAIAGIGPDRLEAFGLKTPKGTLRVTVAGRTHALLVGGSTPGGGDCYARDEATGRIYVIEGSIARDLEGGSGRLSERQLHEWKDAEAESALIKAGDKERHVVRGGTAERRFWADSAKADQMDETAGNWLEKVGRLRPVKYLPSAPQDAKSVVRVVFRSAKDQLGFVELLRRGEGDKKEYVVLSEHIRVHATVARSTGEQIEQDIESVLP